MIRAQFGTVEMQGRSFKVKGAGGEKQNGTNRSQIAFGVATVMTVGKEEILLVHPIFNVGAQPVEGNKFRSVPLCSRKQWKWPRMLCSLALLIVLGNGLRAAPFINLDFELANTNKIAAPFGYPFPTGGGSISDLLPGWNLSLDGTNYDGMFLNVLALDSDGASLISAEAVDYYRISVLNDPFFSFGLEGKYGFAATIGRPQVLSQIGEIPPSAHYINLVAVTGFYVELEVAIDGARVDNGDVRPYAGKTALLEIRMHRQPLGGGGPGAVSINSVYFGPPQIHICPRELVWGKKAAPVIFWPTIPTHFVLQSSSSVSAEASWKEVDPTLILPLTDGPGWGRWWSMDLVPSDGTRFFRLVEK